MLDDLRRLAEQLEPAEIDPRELAAVIDLLQAKLCRLVAAATRRGDHVRAGQTPVSWVAATCSMSKASAADRLSVGVQLDSLPDVERALASGRIGYQATSVICHLSEQLGDKRELIEQEHWVDYARRFSVRQLRYLAREARHAWDPGGSGARRRGRLRAPRVASQRDGARDVPA